MSRPWPLKKGMPVWVLFDDGVVEARYLYPCSDDADRHFVEEHDWVYVAHRRHLFACEADARNVR